MSFVKVLLVIVLTVIFLIFVAQHAYYVDLNFFGMTYKVPLFVIILLSFSAGFLFPTLYFLVRDIKQSGFTKGIINGIYQLARGYPQKAQGELLGSAKKNEAVAWLVVKSFTERGELQKVESLRLKADMGLVDSSIGSRLLKSGEYEKAKGYFLSALSKDDANLSALKGLRDISFLEKDLEVCIKYQEGVLKLCEKWEKETQRKILSEVLTYASEYLPEKRKDLLEKALDIHRSFYVQALWIKYLLEKGDVKEAKKQIEKTFSTNTHNEVFAILSQNEEHLTKIMDIIKEKEDSIDPDVLARIYIKLHLFTQLRPLLERVSKPVKLMALVSESHKDTDKMCGEVVEELFKPWICSCGEGYNNYQPLCERCLTWGKIALRGIKDATGHK